MPRLLVVTDRTQVPAGRSLVDTVQAAVDAGATHVLLRETDLPARERADLAAEMVAAGAIVVASRWPVARAGGVHLAAGQDLHAAGGRWFGRSCHTRAEVAAAAAEGASYVTLSPYGPTPSKPGYGPPQPDGAYAGHPLAVYALGGIAPANAAGARRAGAHGVAVMGAVMRAADPGDVVRRLLAEVAA